MRDPDDFGIEPDSTAVPTHYLKTDGAAAPVQGPPLRTALLATCAQPLLGGEHRLDDLRELLSSFQAAVGGDSFVFALPEFGAQGGRTIHGLSRSHGAKIWELGNSTTYRGYSIPTGDILRHVHFVEWVASLGHAYDRVYVADCAEAAAFGTDSLKSARVAAALAASARAPVQQPKPAAEVYLFSEPLEEAPYFRQGGVERCYSSDFQRYLAPEQQVSTGLWMGTPEGIALISEMVVLEAIHCGHYLHDQDYLNAVVHVGLRNDTRVHFLDSGHGAGAVAVPRVASDDVEVGSGIPAVGGLPGGRGDGRMAGWLPAPSAQSSRPEAERGHDIAVLTLVMLPGEHWNPDASVAETPPLDRLSEGVRRLLRSLQAVDPAASAFVLASEEFLRRISAQAVLSGLHNATVLPFRLPRRYHGLDLPGGNVGRHLVYRETIRAHLLGFSRVVIVDSKDVVFQAPLHGLFSGGLVPGSNDSTAGQIFAFQEPVCAQIRSYWERHAAECYGPSFYTSLPDRAIVNGGVLAGDPRALMVVSSMVAEEALKCLSPKSFRRDQHYLDAVLWSLHSGLRHHEDVKQVRYMQHGNTVVNCNHPKDSDMKIDSSFRVLFKQDGGSWKLPVVLHQYTNRENLLRAVDLRAAEQRELPQLRVCSYPGAAVEAAAARVDDSPELELAARWRHDGPLEVAECDMWFVPLCLAEPPHEWAKRLPWLSEHARKHVYVEPASAKCAERAGTAELLAALRGGGALSIHVGGGEGATENASGSPLQPILAPVLLPSSERAAAAHELALRLTVEATAEDLAEKRRVLRPWKDRLLLDVGELTHGGRDIGGGTPESIIAEMARTKFCLLPRDFSPQWLARAVLALCIPVLREVSQLPFQELFPPSDAILPWRSDSSAGIKQFLELLPQERLEHLQHRLACYRVAFRLRSEGATGAGAASRREGTDLQDGGQDLWESLRLVLQQRFLEFGNRPRAWAGPRGRFAYFVAPFAASDVAGVCQLLKTLAATGTKYPVVIFPLKGAEPPYHGLVQLALCATGLDLQVGEALNPFPSAASAPPLEGSSEPGGSDEATAADWARLQLFVQQGFDRVLQLEADMIVLDNLDSLFDLPLLGRLRATADCSSCEPLRQRPRDACRRMLRSLMPGAAWDLSARISPSSDRCARELRQENPFDAGVLLYQPDPELARSFQRKLQGTSPADFPRGATDFLNAYFQDWLALPDGVNAQVREATVGADRSGWSPGVKLVHWPEDQKPWAVNYSWQQLKSSGLPPGVLAWFASDQAEHVDAASAAVAVSGAGCARLRRLLLLTCATSVQNVAYRQWRSLADQTGEGAIGGAASAAAVLKVRNVCAGDDPSSSSSNSSARMPSTAARLVLYQRAIEQLPKREIRATLVVTSDSFDVVPNFAGLSQGKLVSQMVERFQKLTPVCDKVVVQAEYSCYMGRPCPVAEGRQYLLRKEEGKAVFGGFPNAGLILGRAVDMKEMMASILGAVKLVGLDVAKLRDQPLVGAFFLARPSAMTLDSDQLILGSVQQLRPNRGGRARPGVENVTEQCRAYQHGLDIGPFVCASTSTALEPCCLKTKVKPPSVSGCSLLLTRQHYAEGWGAATSVDLAEPPPPLFVHGQGPYKEPILSAGLELLSRGCSHHELMRPPQHGRLVPSIWGLVRLTLVVALLAVALAVWVRYVRGRLPSSALETNAESKQS